MPQSTITAKNQTTVPREIRERLGLRPKDVLCWEVTDEGVRVTPGSRAFLQRRGSIKTGPGSAVEDVRRARRRIGLETE
jgi:bifunctional DNA-binding transcriptional regulator/antitoxin component of YhaV-PrlF toxin-antitoxin module